jgi:hypothetical protein
MNHSFKFPSNSTGPGLLSSRDTCWRRSPGNSPKCVATARVRLSMSQPMMKMDLWAWASAARTAAKYAPAPIKKATRRASAMRQQLRPVGRVPSVCLPVDAGFRHPCRNDGVGGHMR